MEPPFTEDKKHKNIFLNAQFLTQNEFQLDFIKYLKEHKIRELSNNSITRFKYNHGNIQSVILSKRHSKLSLNSCPLCV